MKEANIEYVETILKKIEKKQGYAFSPLDREQAINSIRDFINSDDCLETLSEFDPEIKELFEIKKENNVLENNIKNTYKELLEENNASHIRDKKITAYVCFALGFILSSIIFISFKYFSLHTVLLVLQVLGAIVIFNFTITKYVDVINNERHIKPYNVLIKGTLIILVWLLILTAIEYIIK